LLRAVVESSDPAVECCHDAAHLIECARATMPLIRPATEADLPDILAIYNDAVAHSTAIWNETLVDLEDRRAWLAERRRRGFPVLVAEENRHVLGYASFGDFRPFEGYRITCEHSVYVAESARRRGIGTALVAALIEEARRQGKESMVGAIDAANTDSIGLHEKLGFLEVGRMPGVGKKFGRKLDLVLMQKVL
jgi:phosphinothricin acetyltransferase